MNTDVADLPKKRKYLLTSLLLSHEKNFMLVVRCQRLTSYSMQLLINISRDYHSEHREQEKNKENPILEHKSVESLASETFHNTIFNQLLVRKLGDRVDYISNLQNCEIMSAKFFFYFFLYKFMCVH